MNQSIRIIQKTSLFIFFTTGVVGLYLLSVQQESSALACAKVGGLASMVYTVITIRDVLISQRLRLPAKVLWIITLILFQVVAGLWYYISGRSANRQQLQA